VSHDREDFAGPSLLNQLGKVVASQPVELIGHQSPGAGFIHGPRHGLIHEHRQQDVAQRLGVGVIHLTPGQVADHHLALIEPLLEVNGVVVLRNHVVQLG